MDTVTQWSRSVIWLAAFYSTSIDSIHSGTVAYFSNVILDKIVLLNIRKSCLKNGNIVKLLEYRYVLTYCSIWSIYEHFLLKFDAH